MVPTVRKDDRRGSPCGTPPGAAPPELSPSAYPARAHWRFEPPHPAQLGIADEARDQERNEDDQPERGSGHRGPVSVLDAPRVGEGQGCCADLTRLAAGASSRASCHPCGLPPAPASWPWRHGTGRHVFSDGAVGRGAGRGSSSVPGNEVAQLTRGLVRWTGNQDHPIYFT